MNEKDERKYGRFGTSRLGEELEYRYYIPNELPERVVFEDEELLLLLEEATQSLGELNAYAKLVPDVNYFISMHEAKEATESSRIEGTKTEIDEAIMEEQEIEPEKRSDWQEVQNYIQAMRYAIRRLDEVPLTVNLLKEAHGILMSGVRGEHRAPGEVRRVQNYIGIRGGTLREAIYVPPPVNELERLLGDLDHYWNDKAMGTPILIKAAISHYQFETIHPFLDGNGRLGRLLIVLFLMEKKKLDKPVLYLSKFFAMNRLEYYEALNAVRKRDDMERWVKFFLMAVRETAKGACLTLEKIVELKEENDRKLMTLGRRGVLAEELLMRMYSDPVMSVRQIAEVLGVSIQAANKLARELVGAGVLVEMTGRSRDRLFRYEEYVRLFGGRG